MPRSAKVEIGKALKGINQPIPALLSRALTGVDLELHFGARALPSSGVDHALFGITFKKSTIDTTKRSDWQLFPFTDFHTKQCALVQWAVDPFNDPRPGYKPYLHFTLTFGTGHDQIVKLIGRELHLDPADRRLTGLTAQQRATIATVDRMGNVAPKVLRCDVAGGTVTFKKEAASDPAGPSRYIYGSIRFLPAPYSSFQLIRGSEDEPGEALLRQIAAVVDSWKQL